MDAISFVLGVQSRHLRSQHLKDLVFRADGDMSARRRASVKLVYEVAADEIEGSTAGTEIWFGRTISASGAGSYRLNGREVSWEVYDKQLREIGVLVRARNFLVFQGDVESIAAKNPRETDVFFEQISGSEDSKAEYELLKGKKEAAEENTIHSFQKRKGYAAERKQVRTALRKQGLPLQIPLISIARAWQVKEQKDEAERFNARLKFLEEMKEEYFMWQIFHIREEIGTHQHEIDEANEALSKIQRTDEQIVAELKAKKKDFAILAREKSTIDKVCGRPGMPIIRSGLTSRAARAGSAREGRQPPTDLDPAARRGEAKPETDERRREQREQAHRGDGFARGPAPLLSR